jgi:restriction endonuclease
MREAAWKRYEKQIADLIRRRAVGPVKITTAAHVTGRLSQVARQVDILIEGNVSGIANVTIVLDCKCISEKVDVKDIEAFLGMVADIGANMACS